MDNKLIFAIVTGITMAGTSAVGLGLYSKCKRQQVDILANGVEVKVDQDVVNAAIEKAVNETVKAQVHTQTALAVNAVKSDIHSQVKDAINTAYSDLKGDVEKELNKQLGYVDISDVRKEVIRKAKEQAAEKFADDLEEVLEKYNSDLENVGKIYSSIANSMTKSNDKAVTLNLV